MSMSISSALPNYQTTYTNQLYRSVDRNYDNSYSKQEVTNFAAEYEESTGVAIDVDGLFEAYDVDLDGSLSYKEYESVKSDDALGMSVLFGAEAETKTESAKESTKAAGTDLSSMLASLSKSQKNTLVQATWKAETSGNLLNAVFGSTNLFSSLNSSYAISQYTNSAKMFSMAQQMGTLSSTMSVNVLL